MPNFSSAKMFCTAVGSIEGVAGSKHQVPLPARGLLVQHAVKSKKLTEGGKIAGCWHILTGLQFIWRMSVTSHVIQESKKWQLNSPTTQTTHS